MALDEYVRSPLGLLNFFAVILNVCAIIACGLQWTHGVSLQIVFTDHVFLSGAQFLFFGATLVLLTVLIFYSFPKTDAQDRLTGGGLVFFLCVAILCELGATVIVIYYVMVDDRNASFYMRFLFILILSVLVIAVLLIMIVIAHKFSRVWAIESDEQMTSQHHHPLHKVVTVTGSHHPQNVHLERSVA